jgi:hypothetical protein
MVNSLQTSLQFACAHLEGGTNRLNLMSMSCCLTKPGEVFRWTNMMSSKGSLIFIDNDQHRTTTRVHMRSYEVAAGPVIEGGGIPPYLGIWKHMLEIAVDKNKHHQTPPCGAIERFESPSGKAKPHDSS